MSKFVWSGVAVVAFLLGFAFAGARERAERPVTPEPAAKSAGAGKIPDVGAEASLVALRERVRELEAALAAAQRASTAAVATAGVAVGEGERRRDGGAWDFRAGMERLKAENPERFNEITNRVAQFRRMREERSRTRLGFLDSVDTSRMGAEERAGHERLRALVARQEELEEKMHDLALGNDERRELMGEMWKNGAEMRELEHSEREMLMRQLAGNLGFEGEDAEALAETVQDIVQATESGFGAGDGHHRRGGFGGGQGGGRRHGGPRGEGGR